jgi:TetR/AcrR family transcriptional regulator, transcriptional repressor of bet genes
MPKLGMGPIRREQICRAAAAVIAREGFAGATMRMVAEQAGVSTGMLNHYFSNRQDLLVQALVFVAERAEKRFWQAMADAPKGVDRLRALLDSVLADDEEMLQTWRVWISASAEAVRVPALRPAIQARRKSWRDVVDFSLEGLVRTGGELPTSTRLDALLNGLAMQALMAESPLGDRKIRDELIRTVLGQRPPRKRKQRASAAGTLP